MKFRGTTASCVEKLLNYCKIDVVIDFNYFNDDSALLLFYKLAKEDREIINTPFVDDTDCKEAIKYKEFPVVCDGKTLKDGSSYHLNELKPINYNNFHIINNLNYEKLDKILKDTSAWRSNKISEFFIDEIISIYKIVSKWIKNKENIYWWQYL